MMKNAPVFTNYLNGETMRVKRPWWIPLMMTLTFVWAVNTVDARIPEPDNIVYGIMPAENSLFSLQINGEVIAQYSRGENPNAGEFFILRVPMDSLDPPEASTARTGDQASLYLDAGTAAEVIVTVGERGTTQRVVLASANDDGDTKLNGDDNCPDIPNDLQDDADYLDTCRSKRNTAEYDSAGRISHDEAKELISFCGDLRKLVVAWLREKQPALAPGEE